MVLAHPPGDKRKERQPEQEMQVRPKDCAIHAAGCFEQMMVIVPIDAQVKETHHVAQKNRQERFDRRPIRSVRHLQLQQHDREDDREHRIAEGFESVLVHKHTLMKWSIRRNLRAFVTASALASGATWRKRMALSRTSHDAIRRYCVSGTDEAGSNGRDRRALRGCSGKS